MRSPFSLKQATLACEDFKYLIGKPLRARADLCEPVIQVLEAPWDELNKWIFIQHLNETNDWDDAISFYSPPYYDVILLAAFKDKDGYFYKDLRSYCEEHRILFNLEKYARPNDPIIKAFPKIDHT